MRCQASPCTAKVKHKDPAKPPLCDRHELLFLSSPFAKRWDPLINPVRSGVALAAWWRVRCAEKRRDEEEGGQ